MAIVTFLFLSVLASAESREVREFDAAKITAVEVKNSSGDIEVLPVTTGKARVVANKVEFGEYCRFKTEQKGSTLFVEVEKKGMFQDDCDVDLELSVAKGTNLNVRLGSGDLKVRGLSGDLGFQVGSGSVDVEAPIKRLDGKTGSGDMFVKGLTSGGTLRTGSGKINIEYLVAPALGELNMATGSGNAEVIFPKAAKVQTTFAAGSGELINELGDSPESKFKVSMRAGSGDLHIKKQ